MKSHRGQNIFCVGLDAAAGYQVYFHGTLVAGSPVGPVKANGSQFGSPKKTEQRECFSPILRTYLLALLVQDTLSLQIHTCSRDVEGLLDCPDDSCPKRKHLFRD